MFRNTKEREYMRWEVPFYEINECLNFLKVIICAINGRVLVEYMRCVCALKLKINQLKCDVGVR